MEFAACIGTLSKSEVKNSLVRSTVTSSLPSEDDATVTHSGKLLMGEFEYAAAPGMPPSCVTASCRRYCGVNNLLLILLAAAKPKRASTAGVQMKNRHHVSLTT